MSCEIKSLSEAFVYATAHLPDGWEIVCSITSDGPQVRLIDPAHCPEPVDLRFLDSFDITSNIVMCVDWARRYEGLDNDDEPGEKIVS